MRSFSVQEHHAQEGSGRRLQAFPTLARQITVAAKMGMPGPAMNSWLRLAVHAAPENMPKDNIECAIKKAS